MNIPFYQTLEQCDRVTVENNTMPYITSMYSCLNRMVGLGYSDDFEYNQQGIESKNSRKIYAFKDLKIVQIFRFEGNSNSGDNVLYVIETSDGGKGTLVKPDSSFSHLGFETLLMQRYNGRQ